MKTVASSGLGKSLHAFSTHSSPLITPSVLWNASVAIYDPYIDKITQIIEYPGITRSASEHIGGVAWDKWTGLITILVDAAAPWATAGADVSGDNLVFKYDADAGRILWTSNLTAVSQARYGGFQDIETDKRGNTFVVGTWPGTILKLDKHGHAEEWFIPEVINTTRAGYGGLAAVGNSDIMLSNDATTGLIYRFDMRDRKGKPVLVPMTPNHPYLDTDAIYLPPKYGGEVLLVASHASGIQVLRSKDKKWKTAEYLGTIPNVDTPLFEGSAPTAAVQMGSNSLYMIDDWLGDPWVPGQTAGNRTLFPMPDITLQVEELLKG